MAFRALWSPCRIVCCTPSSGQLSYLTAQCQSPSIAKSRTKAPADQFVEDAKSLDDEQTVVVVALRRLVAQQAMRRTCELRWRIGRIHLSCIVTSDGHADLERAARYGPASDIR